MYSYQTATPNKNISQLYEEFKVLKNYIDSNKKITLTLGSTPNRNRYQSEDISITPVLLATPQTKKIHRPYNMKSGSKQDSGLGQLSANNNTQSISLHDNSHKSINKSNRQELINEYYKHYEYSIKKVLKCKEKSAKRRKEKQNIASKDEERSFPETNAKKRLQFDANGQDLQTKNTKKTFPVDLDLSTIQRNFQASFSQMINNFEEKLSAKLQYHQERLSKIGQQLKDLYIISNDQVNLDSCQKDQILSSFNKKPEQEQVEIEEFNQLNSQRDDQSLCSQTALDIHQQEI